MHSSTSKCNNNPFPNHENREVNMVSLEEEYEVPNCPDMVGVDAMISTTQPIITVQLREPLTVQTYLPRVVVTTLIARKAEYDTKSVPWDYQKGVKGITIDTAMAQGMTRSSKCYAPKDINQRVIEKEKNKKKNVIDAEAAKFWKKMQSKDFGQRTAEENASTHIHLVSSYEF